MSEEHFCPLCENRLFKAGKDAILAELERLKLNAYSEEQAKKWKEWKAEEMRLRFNVLIKESKNSVFEAWKKENPEPQPDCISDWKWKLFLKELKTK